LIFIDLRYSELLPDSVA